MRHESQAQLLAMLRSVMSEIETIDNAVRVFVPPVTVFVPVEFLASRFPGKQLAVSDHGYASVDMPGGWVMSAKVADKLTNRTITLDG